MPRRNYLRSQALAAVQMMNPEEVQQCVSTTWGHILWTSRLVSSGELNASLGRTASVVRGLGCDPVDGLSWRQDANAAERIEAEQIVVTGNDQRGTGTERTSQNVVIV